MRAGRASISTQTLRHLLEFEAKDGGRRTPFSSVREKCALSDGMSGEPGPSQSSTGCSHCWRGCPRALLLSGAGRSAQEPILPQGGFFHP